MGRQLVRISHQIPTAQAGSNRRIATVRNLTIEQYVYTATPARNLKLAIPQPATSSRDEIW